MTRRASHAACSVVLMLPTLALAWGSIGHRVVGQVADAGLTPVAWAKVSKIMGTSSLGDVANWMDAIRATPEGQRMKPWHYQSIDACDSSKVSCKDKKCAAPQIEAAIATLRSGAGHQRKALSVLVHLVGDIHQPLHAAENGGDVGGNFVIIKNRKCPHYSGKTVDCNLHTYWDNHLVKVSMGNRDEGTFVRDLAKLDVSIAGDAQTWVRESNAVAKSQVHSYKGFACQAGPNTVFVSKLYDSEASPVVGEQLARAGKRLAAILNDIYK